MSDGSLHHHRTLVRRLLWHHAVHVPYLATSKGHPGPDSPIHLVRCLAQKDGASPGVLCVKASLLSVLMAKRYCFLVQNWLHSGNASMEAKLLHESMQTGQLVWRARPLNDWEEAPGG